MAKCDIIIPVWNQPVLTKDCVNSIFANTAPGYRLIIVDNGSEAETKEYLEGLEKEYPEVVKILRNEKNVGFVKAANRGMNESDAPCLCLLNNDTLVYKGWLEEMLAIASSADDIGIVNPSSNNLGQKPAEGEPLELYAERLRAHAGEMVELGAAIGFCMLIKKKVIEKTGLFDEIYGMGNFEDTDLSRKAIQAGFRCVRACGAYVYHRENSSFKRLKNFDYDFKRNKEIFEFRWGKPKRLAYVLDEYDANMMKRLNIETMKLARSGNWIWYYYYGRADVPNHSNIRGVELKPKYFNFHVMFNILKKKKKFDEIYVTDENLGKILDNLSFIHSARVRYY